MPEPKWQYDASTETMYGSFAGIRVETAADIATLFGSFDRAWKVQCRGRRVYLVIDYTGYTVNMAVLPAYAERVKGVLSKNVITIVRYGGDEIQRTSARLVGIRIHVPSRLYATRGEALDVIAAIRAGKMKVEPQA